MPTANDERSGQSPSHRGKMLRRSSLSHQPTSSFHHLTAGSQYVLQRQQSTYLHAAVGGSAGSIGGAPSMAIFTFSNFENVRQIDKMIPSRRRASIDAEGSSFRRRMTTDDEVEVTAGAPPPGNATNGGAAGTDETVDGQKKDKIHPTVTTAPAVLVHWTDTNNRKLTDVSPVLPDDKALDATICPVVVEGRAFFVRSQSETQLSRSRRSSSPSSSQEPPATAAADPESPHQQQQQQPPRSLIPRCSCETLRKLILEVDSSRKYEAKQPPTPCLPPETCRRVPTQSGPLPVPDSGFKSKYKVCSTTGRVIQVGLLTPQQDTVSPRRVPRKAAAEADFQLSPAPCPFSGHHNRYAAGLEQLRTAQNLNFNPPMPKPPAYSIIPVRSN